MIHINFHDRNKKVSVVLFFPAHTNKWNQSVLYIDHFQKFPYTFRKTTDNCVLPSWRQSTWMNHTGFQSTALQMFRARGLILFQFFEDARKVELFKMGGDHYSKEKFKQTWTGMHLMKWKKAENLTTLTKILLVLKKGTLLHFKNAKSIMPDFHIMTKNRNVCKSSRSSTPGKWFHLPKEVHVITLSFSKISYVVRSMLNFNRLVCGCIHSWVLIYKNKMNNKLKEKGLVDWNEFKHYSNRNAYNFITK